MSCLHQLLYLDSYRPKYWIIIRAIINSIIIEQDLCQFFEIVAVTLFVGFWPFKI